MANVYNRYKEAAEKGEIDLLSDNIKCILVSGYTFDADNHQYYSDVSGSEISGTGYTAGGQSLSNKSVTRDDANDVAIFDADDVVWANSSISADGAILYKDTGTASSSPLIAYYPFGETKVSSDSNFTVQWGSDGILRIS